MKRWNEVADDALERWWAAFKKMMRPVWMPLLFTVAGASLIWSIIYLLAQMEPGTFQTILGVIFGVFGFMLALGIYFVPTVVAHNRHHRNTTAIFWLNLFTGWTSGLLAADIIRLFESQTVIQAIATRPNPISLLWVGSLVWALYRDKGELKK
jgi:hypothetical protein